MYLTAEEICGVLEQRRAEALPRGCGKCINSRCPASWAVTFPFHLGWFLLSGALLGGGRTLSLRAIAAGAGGIVQAEDQLYVRDLVMMRIK